MGQCRIDRPHLVRLWLPSHRADAFVLGTGNNQIAIAGFPAGQADLYGDTVEFFLADWSGTRMGYNRQSYVATGVESQADEGFEFSTIEGSIAIAAKL